MCALCFAGRRGLVVLILAAWIFHHALSQDFDPSVYNHSLFNPEVILGQGLRRYINIPIEEEDVAKTLQHIAPFPLAKSLHLMYLADGLSENHFVIGLANYKTFARGFARLVGSLRRTGYNGHIILGVHPQIPTNEFNYLVSMKVTMYAVEAVTCDNSVADAAANLRAHSVVRGKCALGLEGLKLEWARYELAREWMENCLHCQGWGIVIDTRDVFFQDHPFKDLPDPATSSVNLYFIEEISPQMCPIKNPVRSFILWNPRNRGHVSPCYGEESVRLYGERPVLNSGTVLGTREGLRRFLDVLVGEFLANKQKANKKCQSVSDQWTMNWLYYHGRFGQYQRTASIPWGFGPILTAGKACITEERSAGASDIIRRDGKGRLMTSHDGKVAAMVHQYDRCGDWIEDYMDSLNFKMSTA
jgi:hypothetical protein